MTLPKPYYQDAHVTLYCGDCREILPELGKCDLLLTDPPYLLPNMTGGGRFGNEQALVDTKGFTDGGFESSILCEYENWFCFCSKNNLVDVISRATSGIWNILHWCKTNPLPTCNNSYLPDVEYCVHRRTKGRLFGDITMKSLFEVRPQGQKSTSHPNEKPINFIRRLVRLGTQPDELIFDPFMGSGTTLVAAKLEGRRAVGIELDEKWCAVSAERLRQGVLF